ncbi:hypothetical protein [Flavobacterium panici]|uniref:Uncharacterized protein n=1 Tax=Flavobacterium panici TaxID=2654843 RepID=A0A9N8IYJ6_9FLAO|nr:hypothetical protein [Flavobacterium panici]CAC9972891.1 hypothetical protein FLAPXU55_00570 [Flavobacterium panici]
MRPLSIVELESKITSYSDDIIFSDHQYNEEKITQFFNFLHNQPISRRILERIYEDFPNIHTDLPKSGSNVRLQPNIKKQIKSLLKTREDQGAFGFFTIQNLYEIERKFPHQYIDITDIWYDRTGTKHSEICDYFLEKFFKPFIELLDWYIYEGQVRNERDYFSKKEITELNEKLDKIMTKQDGIGELLFEEIENIKELILFLNKKNLLEVIKGKVTDTALGLLINDENVTSFINHITKSTSLLG